MMKIDIPSGKYVLAVSGGVDSMVLLDLLVQKLKQETRNKKHEFIVAHFDHGIRPDSQLDAELVKKTATKDGLRFESQKGKLGPNASEDTARKARYEFLEAVRQKYNAKAVITAHHQDDLIETALLNIIRGTKRKGLSAMATNPKILRPMLKTPKRAILDYARKHKLKWHDDPTNLDTKILRNYLRLKIIPTMTIAQRRKILKNIDNIAKINKSVDKEIATLSQSILKKDKIDRSQFTLLPTEVTQELVVHWLKRHGVSQPDSKTVSRLAIFIKTSKVGGVSSVKGSLKMKVDKQFAYFA